MVLTISTGAFTTYVPVFLILVSALEHVLYRALEIAELIVVYLAFFAPYSSPTSIFSMY